MVKKILLIGAAIIGVLGLGVVVFLLVPSPIDPVAFQPPVKPPLAGALAPNALLVRAEVIARGLIDGPETITCDRAGNIYGGTQDGKILRIKANGKVETFAATGGRPLGLQFDTRGNLIVCDAYKGLLEIDPQGAVRVLSTEAEGVPFKFTDDLDISSNGDIYFSDASFKYSQADYLFDLLEARPNGRLLVYRPETQATVVLLKDLYFANGVALSRNEDFVLVNETYRYRITRCWLKGPRVGTSDIFSDNLPGFADGLTRTARGTFWAPMFTVRNDVMDSMHPNPFVKSLLAKLPKFLWPTPAPYALVVELNERGEILRSLHDPGAETIFEVTGVEERDGYLYLGFLHQNYCARYKLE